MRAICFLVSIVLFAAAAGADAKQPNIIVVLADDLGYSDLGCYGGEIPTPNIDALAGGGVKFTQMYNSARCCPSRASLMTGLYPSQAGIGDFTSGEPSRTRGPGYLGRLNDQCATLAEVLKPAGYDCYYVGKWHMHHLTGPIKRGFDEFYGYTRNHSHDQYDSDHYIRLPEGRKKEIDPPADEYYATDVFNQYALEFIRQGQQTGKPWFLFLGHSSPHFPVQAPADRADKYETTYLRGWDKLREERFAKMKELGLVDGDHWQFTPRSLVPVDRRDIANGSPGQPNPAWDSVDEDRQRDLARRMAVFAAMVEGVDSGVGQIVDHLKATGELDNTLILFLSDNGACYEWGPFGFDDASRQGTTTLHTGDDLRKIGGHGTYHSYGSAWANLGNTPFRLYKHFTHEGGISTPFIAHWPRRIPSRDEWVRDPVHVMDLMPTVIRAAGAKYPNQMRGKAVTPLEGTNLLPAMRGEPLPPRTLGFDHQSAHALREGDWKLVWSKRMPHKIKWELYNLAEDRCEMNDLAESLPDRVKAMAAKWERWARHVDVKWEAGEVTRSVDQTNGRIAKRSLVIQAEIEAETPHGVVLAHGGNQQGYALHFVKGRPVFEVRVNGLVHRLQAAQRTTGVVSLRATLTSSAMSLGVNDDEPCTIASPGLIPVEPLDSSTVGYDDLSAAGQYTAPNRFNGKILSHRVTIGSRPFSFVNTPLPLPAAKGKRLFGAVTRPLFADPHYNGSCDPEVVWNPAKRQWYVYYTARRATREKASYVGTPLGVATSSDLVNWRFGGYCSFDGRKGQPDNEDTHWAPGIIRSGDKLHMFATYKASSEPPWGAAGVIRHYTAPLDDPIDGWRLAGVPNFHQPDPIDASLIKVGDRYRAFYRVGKGGGIQWAESSDLIQWENKGACPGDLNTKSRGYGYQEAPYVFQFGDRFWMLTDPHKGLAVFQSSDGVTWTLQERILEQPGAGEADATLARHPSVAVVGDRAFVFYHTEPNRPYPTPAAERRTPHQKVSFLQMAELTIDNGRLVCDRNAAIQLPDTHQFAQ